MNKPHQHFIPRTYLEHFSTRQDGDKYFVTAVNKLKGKIIDEISVKDVCVETDFYTLKNLAGHEKYKVENFFADNIESKYSSVYKTLVTDKKIHISPEERVFILYTTLSMYFRTPKVLNRFVSFAADLVERTKTGSESDKINFVGYDIEIKDKSFDEIKKEIRETHRIDYIKTQVALLNQFVKFKAANGLMIIELVGDQEFVTSDNPVEIRSSIGTGFNLFDARNSIYIPLDPKHALFIAPNTEGSIVNQVHYIRDNFFQHVVLNHLVHENAERWVMGTKQGVLRFLKDHEEYSKPAEDDDSITRKYKSQIEIMWTITMLLEKGISNENKELIAYMRAIQTHELFKEDIGLQDTLTKLRAMGLDI